MSVYFNYSLATGVAHPAHVDLAGHPQYSILAVACEGTSHAGQPLGVVNVFKEDGNAIEGASVHRSCPPVLLEWHPVQRLLAVAWKSGEITVYNDEIGDVIETSLAHKSGVVVFMLWNAAGTRLVSGDESGELAVWHFHSRSKHAAAKVHSTAPKMPNHTQSFDGLAAGVMCNVAETSQTKHVPLSLNPDKKTLALEQFLGRSRHATSQARSAPLFNEMLLNHPTPPRTPLSFYVGTPTGGVFYLNASNDVVRVTELDSGVHVLKMCQGQGQSTLVVLTERQELVSFPIKPDGSVGDPASVRLSSVNFPRDIIWTVPGLLAYTVWERSVNMWNFNTQETVMIVPQNDSSYIKCIAFNGLHANTPGVLVAGTDNGFALQWWYTEAKRKSGKATVADDEEEVDPATQWEALDPISIEGNPTQIQCVGPSGVLAYVYDTRVVLLRPGVMSACFNNRVCAVQVGPSRVIVENVQAKEVRELRTDLHVNGLHASDENVLIWNYGEVAVYGATLDGSYRVAGSFQSQGTMFALFKQSVIIARRQDILITSFTGTEKQSLRLQESDGDCELMSINEPYLVVGTGNAMIRVYDLSRREARCIRSANVGRQISHTTTNFYSLQCNSDCTFVSFQFKRPESDVPDPRLFIWDFETDDIHVMDFESMATGLHDCPELSPPLTTASDEIQQLAKDRCPISHFWDKKDTRLLVCECARVCGTPSLTAAGELSPRRASAPESKVDVAAISLFFTSEHGVLFQDCFQIDKNCTGLLGVSAPFIYFSKKYSDPAGLDVRQGVESAVATIPMRDFSDVDKAVLGDASTCSALLDFSFHLTLGNLDEAFSRISKIKSNSIWQNLAKMCVKAQRLDVASACISNMGDVTALRAMRDAKTGGDESEAQLAVIAIHLGMLDDAVELLTGCGRFDLLNDLHRARDDWDSAVRVAQDHDPIRLRNTHYAHAKRLELEGNTKGAAQFFEKAGTHIKDVPRMLASNPAELQTYVAKSHNSELSSYWGSYLESMDELDMALEYYSECADHLNQVRILCFSDRYQEAATVARRSGNKAACFHFAKQCEQAEMTSQAVEFYSLALAYTNAIRVAKECHMDHELMGLALRSTKEDKVEVAEYFDMNGVHSNAVILYQKGGAVAKAIELAFNSKEYDALDSIAADLDDDTDPELLMRCADFFLSNGQHERAVPILVSAKKYVDAIELCSRHRIELTKEMAERMTPPKTDNEVEKEKRRVLLERMAMCAEEQGSFQLACKKFTQGEMPIKAMKALLKHGKVETILLYANASRNKELFLMAANWLQLQGWHNDPSVVTHIVSMYTKARAPEPLASFYEACASCELDEYRDYEKAMGALEQAVRYLQKAKRKSDDVVTLESRVDFLETRISLMRKFLETKALMKTDPEASLVQCRALIGQADVETAVAFGDIYSLMVEYYAQRGDAREAYELMQELSPLLSGQDMAYYIPLSIIENVHRSLGIPLGRGLGGDRGAAQRGGAAADAPSDDDDDDIADELGV
ncbi:intraflagellar transport protein 140 homolog [Sycon ciliatum]|uniref:intraflagellar transport protein 140 homolog n=1 Tax=Sycon ciliatum TaxID=27933 RepID=UPI0020AB2E4D|eukprot:scpid10955/ scgid6347/ Intraflagellar transport protein 140 homolog; WD and tetratricopeptide repeats protein 2